MTVTQRDINTAGAAEARRQLALARTAPALRAGDEIQVRRHGPIAAIVQSPTQDTAVRRAAYVLGMHRDPFRAAAPVTVHDVFTALAAWHLMRGTRAS